MDGVRRHSATLAGRAEGARRVPRRACRQRREPAVRRPLLVGCHGRERRGGGREPELWAQSLLGRLIRKTPAGVAGTAANAKNDAPSAAPAWIVRTLEIVADTLLLVRFAMNFRFKEMKDLIFTHSLAMFSNTASTRCAAVGPPADSTR